MTTTREQQIITLYNNGASYNQIKKAVGGVHSNEISYILKRNGVTMRGRPAHLKSRGSAKTAPTKSVAQPTAQQQSSGLQVLQTLVETNCVTIQDIMNFVSQQASAATSVPSVAVPKLTAKQRHAQDRYHRIRTYKRDSGLSDEKVARHFDVSIGTVRKAQGKK